MKVETPKNRRPDRRFFEILTIVQALVPRLLTLWITFTTTTYWKPNLNNQSCSSIP